MKPFILYLTFLLCASAFSEMRVWTLKNGKTIEAEFVAAVGGKVTLKTGRKKTVKLSEAELSKQDLSFIELQMPPKLDLSFSKKTKMRVFPQTNTQEIPRSQYYDFTATIKQLSTRPYSHELTVEFFVIGKENVGDKHILLDYQKAPFRLGRSGSRFELPSRTVEIMEYVINTQLRGEAFAGYLIIVTDSRGEVIAYNTKKDEWFQRVENLRKLPVGKYFDDECNRAWPTRPKRWY